MTRSKLRKINVFYTGWEENWFLGTLARLGSNTTFTYSDEALSRGLEFSPYRVPLRRDTFTDFERAQGNIPGFIDDALPDGWGLRIIDRFLKEQGVASPDAFDRLRVLGQHAMGALRFEPVDTELPQTPDWTLLELAERTRAVGDQTSTEELSQLAKTGGSAQGARPKALVYFDPVADSIANQPSPSHRPWLFKFPSHDEHKETCAIEALYAELARSAGIHMPATIHKELSTKLAAFGVERFDRHETSRVPMLSLAGFLQIDFRNAGIVGYLDWLKATRLLTRSQRQVEIAFGRAVFNVVFFNRDDHPKNFSWLLSQSGQWEVSPAYDLTFTSGPGGEHHLDILGKGNHITRSDLLKLAHKSGIEASKAVQIIDNILLSADQLPERIDDYPIRKSTQKLILKTVKHGSNLVQN